MDQCQDIYIDTPYLRLAAKCCGPKDGIPVLAIHGWLDNAASFDLLAPLLEGCRLVAIDLPGHGKSDHRSLDACYHFVDWPRYPLAAAQALNWERFNLIGHSMGASIAAYAAAICPERIGKLVMIEGMGPLSSEADSACQRLRKHLTESQRLAAQKPPFWLDLQQLIDKRKKIGDLPEAAARRLIERGVKQVPGGWKFRGDPQLRGSSASRLSEKQVLAVMREITCPTLLIHTDAITLYDKKQLEQRCAAIANLTAVKLTGGHHVHMEIPQKIAQITMDFLRK